MRGLDVQGAAALLLLAIALLGPAACHQAPPAPAGCHTDTECMQMFGGDGGPG